MPLPPVSEKKFTEGFGPGGATTGSLRIIVTGAGGFIASHLSKRLKAEGHFVRAVDWKENEYMAPSEFCDEFKNLDLRWPDKCKEALEDGPWDWCFNLAADMGGMGFIQSNHSRILFNSTMISFNVAEAARVAGVKRFWYASSACIYPEYKQLTEDLDGASGLKEDDAWPAQPQDAYGLEKLMTEELLMHYEEDFGMVRAASGRLPLCLPAHPLARACPPQVCRIGRFHNIYGPCGTWKGGREKAPASFCRKAVSSTEEFEMWGNGKQTRSFCYIDDAVEGILRLMVRRRRRRRAIPAQRSARNSAISPRNSPTRAFTTPRLSSPLRRRTTRSRSTLAPTRWSR